MVQGLVQLIAGDAVGGQALTAVLVDDLVGVGRAVTDGLEDPGLVRVMVCPPVDDRCTGLGGAARDVEEKIGGVPSG